METPTDTTPFTKCPTCKALVVAQCWHHKDAMHAGPYWQALPQPVDPIRGTPHACPLPAEEDAKA
jgi:hypothetical protein